MDKNFSVAINSLVKLFISNFSILDADFMRYDEARLGFSGDN